METAIAGFFIFLSVLVLFFIIMMLLLARDIGRRKRKRQLRALNNLVNDIRVIAGLNKDIDPSAEVILMRIHEYKEVK
jgi:preprotein translocase subunit YajC